MNPVLAGAISYTPGRVKSFNVGSTAIRKGDIIKFSSAEMVAAADNDKQGQFWVALDAAPADGTTATNTGVLAVPLQDCLLRIAYSGGDPTVGEFYAISDTRTLDTTDTTNDLLQVLEYNSAEGYAICQAKEATV